MTPVYPTTTIYYDADNDGIPDTDLSARVVGDFDLDSGIKSYRDTDRLANVGTLSFPIRNDDGAHTNVASTLIGRAVSLRQTVGGRTKQIWAGTITPNSDIDSGEWGPRRINIKATDWVDIANSTRVGVVTLATFVTANEAIPTLLDIAPIEPTNTDLSNGFERFPNMFDGALKSTVLYSEFDKITKSELGYLYLTYRDNTYGETLRFEDYLHRGSNHPLSSVPKDVVTPGYLKYHGNAGASGYLKYHGNAAASGKIKLSQTQTATFDRLMTNSEWDAGKNVINQMSVNQIPRKSDASLVVLYKISSPIPIGTSQTLKIEGSYTDPNGGTVIQATEPTFATSDYSVNSASNGSGTDLKANTQAGFTDGTNAFSVSIWNGGPAGYITDLQVRGKGTYKYSKIEVLKDNEESQTSIVKSIYSDSITREYSADYNVSETFANGTLAQDRTPRKVMKSVSFIANTSEHLMMAFTYMSVGDKVRIVESSPSHTGDYYIQGIKAKIALGGGTYFTWYLKEDTSTICQPVVTDGPTAEATVSIDFGILPYLSNLRKFSYSFWVKRTAADSYAAPIGHSVDEGAGRRGQELYLVWDDLVFKSYKTPNDGSWTVNSAAPNLDEWYHIVLTYDNTTDRADPIVYVNGSSATVTEDDTPTGISDDDSDCPLILFNVSPDPAVAGQRYYIDYIHDVSMKHIRIYRGELEAADALALYNAGDSYITLDNPCVELLFCGVYAPSDNIADFIGDTIENDDLVLDIVHRAAGIPYNASTADADMLHGSAL